MMKFSPHFTGGVERTLDRLRPYRGTLIAVLIGAIVISVFIHASRATSPATPPNPLLQSTLDLRRACSSKGTIFENIRSIDDLVEIFQTEASAITDERMTLLETPSKWVCPTKGTDPSDPPMPKLTSLSARLPGWSYEYPSPFGFGTVTLLRPVTFSSFSSILTELGREYECRLLELRDEAISTVSLNYDLPKGTMFCCSSGQCKEQTPNVACTGPSTPSPFCDNQCSLFIEMSDLASRYGPYVARAETERTTAKVALEPTVELFRSYDLNYAHARDLMCYARASMDLRAEMNLLATVTSCIPKIWDAVTSLHDRSTQP